MIRKTDILIIGGGQAGLATSRCLSDMGLDHVVLERGQIAQRWRAERWASLRLLTPNWMTRLPGNTYAGHDPDGFMHKDQLVELLVQYGAYIAAPVMTNAEVSSLYPWGAGFRANTNLGIWQARAVVLATGACDTPRLPGFAAAISPDIQQISLNRYKTPEQVAEGGVLVVGASASGIQIAHELLAAGRRVTLAVGQHTRIPRRYRGRDIMYWLDQTGLLSQRRDPQADSDSLAALHSFQLIGTAGHQPIDLASFQVKGGRVAGRMINARDRLVGFDTSLAINLANADARQARLLLEIDEHLVRQGVAAPLPDPILPIAAPKTPSQMDLRDAGINTIVWGTGYKRDYSWLDIPVLSPGGEIVQQGGITPVPGLYTMGLPVMRRRNSTFIDGVGQDARDITQMIARHLGHVSAQAA